MFRALRVLCLPCPIVVVVVLIVVAVAVVVVVVVAPLTGVVKTAIGETNS